MKLIPIILLLLAILIFPMAIYGQDQHIITDNYDYEQALEDGDIYGVLGRVLYWVNQTGILNDRLIIAKEELRQSKQENISLITQNNRLVLENQRINTENIALNDRLIDLNNVGYQLGDLAFDFKLGVGTSIMAGMDFKIYLGGGLFTFAGIQGIYGRYMNSNSFLEPPYLCGLIGLGFSL